MIKNLKIKICCIKSIQEAELAISHGASAIGLVGPMPSGPGIITDELIHELARHVKNRVETFLLTSHTNAQDVIAHHRKTGTTTIQLVDHVPVKELKILRKEVPDLRIVQVIHVMDEQNIEEAKAVSPYVDALLLDSGKPNLSVKVLGGTGRTHNWNISRSIVATVNVPVYLAGGLKSTNVTRAITSVNPYGIDLCSGVRTNDELDPIKLKSFMDRVIS